MSSILLTC